MARISAVAQITGASGLMAASPVSIPTRSAPSWAHRSKNFSDTSALIGAVYQVRWPSAQGGEVGAEGDEALARPGRGVDDDVAAGEGLEDGFLLGRVERQAPVRRPLDERLENLVRLGTGGEVVDQAVHAKVVGNRRWQRAEGIRLPAPGRTRRPLALTPLRCQSHPPRSRKKPS